MTNDQWEYLGALNQCIAIVLCIAIGFVMAHFKVFEVEAFLPIFTQYLFYIALPFHVFSGLGIVIDLYNELFLWDFIGAFIVLQGIALLVCLSIVWLRKKGGMGDAAVMWLNMTWISTVLGIPVVNAIIPGQGGFFGILAGISAIIFQLPLQLVLFECHQVEQEHRNETTANKETTDRPAQEQPLEGGDEVEGEDEAPKILAFWSMDTIQDPNKWMRLGEKLVRNPVIDALLIGLVLTLSTAGPRFLNAFSTDYVPGFAYIATTTKWFNDTLLPLSMFMVGLTLHQQKECLRLPSLANLLYMIAKLVVIPTVMLGLAKAFQLTDVAGRAAVLISCMPVVAAAFPLGSHYKIKEVVLAENILLGTILLIPTVLLWNLFLDAVKVFPTP